MHGWEQIPNLPSAWPLLQLMEGISPAWHQDWLWAFQSAQYHGSCHISNTQFPQTADSRNPPAPAIFLLQAHITPNSAPAKFLWVWEVVHNWMWGVILLLCTWVLISHHPQTVAAFFPHMTQWSQWGSSALLLLLSDPVNREQNEQ